MKRVVKSVEIYHPLIDNRITICEVPNWFLRLFGIRERTRIYVGQSTVWRDLETGHRPGTVMESWLSAIEWKKARGD